MLLYNSFYLHFNNTEGRLKNPDPLNVMLSHLPLAPPQAFSLKSGNSSETRDET